MYPTLKLPGISSTLPGQGLEEYCLELMQASLTGEYQTEDENDQTETIPIWTPFPGPQTAAFECLADELFFGGGAGGGKSFLLLGVAIRAHHKSIIFRREYPQLSEIIDASKEILGSYGVYNDNKHRWILPHGGRSIQFGAMQHEHDKLRWLGRPHDLKAFDELPQFTQTQYTFACGWARTSIPGQRVRKIGTGNPPTEQEGFWIISHWRPWLDTQYSYPAQPCELRWFAMIDGEDEELENGTPFAWKGEQIVPQSRTFIPARVDDNPVYMATGYKYTLQNMPEPLRSQLLYGDFSIGIKDNAWQVIPSTWIRAAQERWKQRKSGPEVLLTCLGSDIAHGGADRTVICLRYGNWIAPLEAWQGTDVDEGDKSAELILSRLTALAYVHIDALSVGASAYDSLKRFGRDGRLPTGVAVHPINFGAPSQRTDKTGKYKFRNIRAEAYWTLREILDPQSGEEFCIPPDPELLAELCAARFEVNTRGIQIEDKDAIKARLGHSPDKAEALVLSTLRTPAPDSPTYISMTGTAARRG